MNEDDLDEFGDERDPDLVSLIDEQRGWQRLIDSPEWGKLITMLQGQVDEFQRILLAPAPTRKEQMLAEFRKGQLEGRLSISNSVETIIADLQMDIERKRDGTR